MGGHFAPLRGSADPKNGHFYSVTSGDLAFDLTEKNDRSIFERTCYGLSFAFVASS